MSADGAGAAERPGERAAPTSSDALDLDLVEGVLAEDVARVADLGDALLWRRGGRVQ